MNTTGRSRGKLLLIGAWLIWERLFHKWYSVAPIDTVNPLFYYRICVYRGKTIDLSGGESIASGDKVMELHFNNKLLVEMGAGSASVVSLAAKLIHDTKQLLPVIAEKMEHDPEYRGVKGIYGITMIHRGTRQLGFTVVDLPRGLFRAVTRLYLTLLLYVIHPEGKKRLHTSKEAFVPKLLAFSAQELVNKYGARRIASVEPERHDIDGQLR